MRRRAAALICAAAACAEPPAPPPPPADRLPPQERAASCGPGPQFAHAEFYLADLGLASSCRVFLEQDECILAIFRDCSWDEDDGGMRQWLGRVDRGAGDGYDVVLEPVHERAPRLPPPKRCSGELKEHDGPRPHVYLDCGTGDFHDVFLEKKDNQARAFGTRSEETQLSVVATPSQSFFAAQELRRVEAAGRRELWTVVEWQRDLGGVWIHEIGGESVRSEHAIPLSDANKIGVDLDRGRVLVGAKAQTQMQGNLHLFDAATRTQTATTTVGGEVLEIVALPTGEWLVAYQLFQPARSALIRLDGTTLRPLGPPLPIADKLVKSIAVTHGVAGVSVVVAANDDALEAVILGLGADLSERWTIRESGLDVEALVWITGRDRVGLVAHLGNRYHELDLAEGTLLPPIPVPFFDGLYTTAYDASRDWVYVVSRWGHVTPIDRAAGRALQASSWISSHEQSSAVWDEVSGKLYILKPEIGKIDVLTPTTP